MPIQFFITSSDGERLVARIKSNNRPIVVVHALSEGEISPPAWLEKLDQQLDDDAEVCVVSAEASWSLTDGLGGAQHSVHSGWTRIYPPTEWRATNQNRFRFEPANPRNADRTIKRIVDRTLDVTFRSYVSSAPPIQPNEVNAEVEIDSDPNGDDGWQLTGRRVDVRSPQQIFVHIKHLYPGIPLDRLVKKGMRFLGVLEDGRIPSLYASKPTDDLERRVCEFVGDGVTTWAYVSQVQRDRTELLIHPDVALVLTSSPDEDLRMQFTIGETAGILVMPKPNRDGYDVVLGEPDVTTTALSVFPLGPPWLTAPILPTDVVEDDDVVESSDELVQAQREIDEKDRELAVLRIKLREANRIARTKTAERPHQLDTDCFKADMRNEYFKRFPDRADRDANPLVEVTFGPDFIEGVMTEAQKVGVGYQKIVEKAMLIACNHRNGAKTKFKPGSKWSSSPDGWVYYRGHIVERTHDAPRFVVGIRGNEIHFEECNDHDKDI